jgi:putative ABC transport system permease protein
MNRFWAISFRNLRRNLKRNLATGSAIALGFAGIVLLGGYVNRVTNYLRVHTVYVLHTGHFAIFPKDGFEKFSHKPKSYSLSSEDQGVVVRILTEDLNVDFFERQLQGSGLVGNGCLSFPFLAQGIEPKIDQRMREHPEVLKWVPKLRTFLRGRGLWSFEEKLGPIALSVGLARALGKNALHDEVADARPVLANCSDPSAKESFGKDANVQLLSGTWAGSMGAIDGEVVAHFSTGFQESDNAALFLPVSRLQRLLDTENVSRVSVWLKDPAKLRETMERVSGKLRAQGRHYDLLRWNEERLSPYYVGTVQFLDSMVGFLGAVLAAVIAFSVLNSTTMTMLERSQEIGMYRSLGFRRKQVSALFVWEAFWLTSIGLVAGSLLGRGSVALINWARIIYHPPGVTGGLPLVLIPSAAYGALGAVVILALTLGASYLAVASRMRSRVVELLGGTKR